MKCKKKIYGAAWHLITKKTEKMFVCMRRWSCRDSADIILLKKFINNNKKLNSNKKKHETKNRINIINYGNKFWFIFSAFIFLIFFFHLFKVKKKWRILPLTTFNVEVWPVTKWSITLLFFFLIVYAKQVRCNATCVTFAYYIINLMNGLCQRTLCRSRSLLH